MAAGEHAGSSRRQVILIVIDGWGIAPDGPANAISLAQTPIMDRLQATSPYTSVATSGQDVGLPAGQIGNSEVGHLNIGAGYPVLQDLPRIDREIETGTFFENAALVGAVEHVRAGAGNPPDERPTLHLMGLYSEGGVHSHAGHCLALVGLARRRGLDEVQIHTFLDGRDVPPRQALEDLTALDRALAERPGARVATVIGRYFAMDRDKRWDRTAAAYNALVLGEGERADSASDAVRMAYVGDVGDEFVKPTIVGIPTTGRIKSGDAVIFFNFRADRARQLTRAFVLPDFDGFERRAWPHPLHFVTFADYEADLPVTAVAFPPTLVEAPLARVVAEAGLRQLHVAETEKYAHVTYFLNGGHEAPFPGEDRVLVPSPKVATYDLQPEMSAAGVTAQAIEGLRAGYDFIVLNYANPDMVGHTGVLDAAVVAVETVDRGIGEIVRAAEEARAVVVVTADHGNAEEMIDPETGQPKTAHTTNPVPVIVVGAREVAGLRAGGRLSDVAPTVLDLLGLPTPAEMTAQSLLVR
ncbi:MAG: 2,3-bisphosphoglycerate-independent phosphoglycerate mutase [Chloroflexota bacterium]|nr:2,3-bisphosphoglycerate-independent phosphoglycerate mutase [Chloroflexota bacterium]